LFQCSTFEVMEQIDTPSGAILKKSWQAVSITVGLSTPIRFRQPRGRSGLLMFCLP
jgi:hypothetical protein